ncbi:MAG: XRE family transcriptional regulator [Opitutus sp.]|nr:XRE family transcriptional regulator [Opitutus sp.]
MQTIGERFDEARKKKGISIREAAEATKIRGDYLQKFESNQFDIGLTEIYTRGFLRNYATFLKLPADRLLNDYAALGRGAPRPRQPNREVYGRMDISVATAGEPSDRAAPPDETTDEPAPARAQPRYPRGGSALPAGPDPALIFRYVKWGGLAVLAVVAILVIKSLLSPAATPARPTPAAAAPPPASERTITLVALDVVFVRVVQKNSDEGEGAEIFKGNLVRGQRQVVPWAGPIYIWASAGENLKIEYKGTQLDSKFTGYGRAQMN